MKVYSAVRKRVPFLTDAVQPIERTASGVANGYDDSFVRPTFKDDEIWEPIESATTNFSRPCVELCASELLSPHTNAIKRPLNLREELVSQTATSIIVPNGRLSRL
jgi:hypothetical protein